MHFVDKAKVSSIQRMQDGYLVADAFTVRAGIQIYGGMEVKKPHLTTVRVLRPESEVFSKDSINSFAHVPVTVDHPPSGVSAENWKDLAVGEVSTDVLRDGEKLKLSLVVKDARAINTIESGKQELSAGYSCDLVWESGVDPKYGAYDAYQKDIRANHVAIVDRGRAGPEFRIGDDAGEWGAAPIVQDREIPMTLRTIVVDGISIQTTDQGAEAIQKLNGQILKVTTDSATLEADLRKQLADKDAEVGTLKAQLADAQKVVPNVDQLVADRALLIDTASKFVKDFKAEGKTEIAIKKEVVDAKYGEGFTKDSSDTEVNAMFKVATKDAPTSTDPVRQSFMSNDKKAPQVTNDHGYSGYVDRVSNAWKGTQVAK